MDNGIVFVSSSKDVVIFQLFQPIAPQMSTSQYWLQSVIMDDNLADTCVVPLGAVRHDIRLMQQYMVELQDQVLVLQSSIQSPHEACSSTFAEVDILTNIEDDIFDSLDKEDHLEQVCVSDLSSMHEIDADFLSSFQQDMELEFMEDHLQSTTDVRAEVQLNGSILSNLPVRIATYCVNERDTFVRAQAVNDRFIMILNSCSPNDLFEENSVLQMKSVSKPGRVSDEHTRVAAEQQFFCKIIHKVYGVPMLGLWQIMMLSDRRCINPICKTLAAPVGGKWFCPSCSLNKKCNLTWDEGLLAYSQLSELLRMRHIQPNV